MRKVFGEVHQSVRFDKDIEQIEHAIARADRVFNQADALRFGLRFKARDGEQPALVFALRVRDMDVLIARQVLIELCQPRQEPRAERLNKRLRLKWLIDRRVQSCAPLLVAPLRRQVLARIAERLAAFDPHFFAFQRALKFLQDA